MAAARQFWLVKSEPDVFSFQDLQAAKQRETSWDGVRNYQARNFLRAMAVGDEVLYYHSSCLEPGVAGIASVVHAAIPDPTQFDPQSPGFDPASTREQPRWDAVRIRALRALPRFVTLDALRAERRLAGMRLLARGNRLSVLPVTPQEWRVIAELGGLS